MKTEHNTLRMVDINLLINVIIKTKLAFYLCCKMPPF